MSGALDHGVLNVSLEKRGNIDVQIDRYKAAIAVAGRLATKERHQALEAARVEAKRLVAETTAERAASLAERCKVTVPALLKHLRSEAHWRPRFVISLLAEVS